MNPEYKLNGHISFEGERPIICTTTDEIGTAHTLYPKLIKEINDMGTPFTDMQTKIDKLEAKMKWLEAALAILLDGKEINETIK